MVIYFNEFCGRSKEEIKAETTIFLQIKGGEDESLPKLFPLHKKLKEIANKCTQVNAELRFYTLTDVNVQKPRGHDILYRLYIKSKQLRKSCARNSGETSGTSKQLFFSRYFQDMKRLDICQ